MFNNIQLTPKEVVVIQTALEQQILYLEEVSKDPSMPFPQNGRKNLKDILANYKSALEKMLKIIVIDE